MKSHFRKDGSLRRFQARRGVALIIILCMLVLITVLIIGFFSSVTTDFTTTQNYANAANAKQLGESAVNLVMAQIVQATTTGTTNQGASTATWTSQPGMIRTFNNDGTLGSFYKLYSSSAMIVPGATFSAAAEAPSASGGTAWNLEPAIYTDLNSPVLVSDSNGNIVQTSGTYRANFPIIDGNNLGLSSTLSPSLPLYPQDPTATYLTYYTGAAGNGVPDIAGFYVKQPPTSIYNGNLAQISGTNTPVPMPVQWLYVLQNGTILAPNAPTGSTNTATFSTTLISATNPIVGRIAFWTDDETSKVNINTAAGDVKPVFPMAPYSGSGTNGLTFGTFWDTPKADTGVERGYNPNVAKFIPGLAMSQPYQNEYQRYPGHPASVALNTIFPTLTRAEIAGICPRTQNGGSYGGTVPLQASGVSALSGTSTRLYASIDELMFQPWLSGSTRELNDPTTTWIYPAKIEQSKFFLTASSRAPDLNLFGQPRVSIWPLDSTITNPNGTINQNSQRVTAFDKLIAYCSTTGTTPYYFVRQDPTSSSWDYMNFTRNQSIYGYLQNLMAQPIPGLNLTGTGYTNFRLKYPGQPLYPTDCDQILTEIFDYIRCTNLCDSNLSGTSNGYTPTEWAQSTTSGGFTYVYPTTGAGVVAPIQISGSSGPTQGLGRFPTLMEAALDFYVDQTGTVPVLSGTTYVTGTAGTDMKVVFLPKLFDPMHGDYPPEDCLDETGTFSNGPNDWKVQVGYTGTAAPLNMPSNGVTNNVWLSLNNTGWGGRQWGGEQQISQNFLVGPGFRAPKTLSWTSGQSYYPFCSDPNKPGINLSGTNVTYIASGTNAVTTNTPFYFSGGTVTFSIYFDNPYQPTPAQTTPIQTFKLTFPPSTVIPISNTNTTGGWPLPLMSGSYPLQYQTATPYNWRIGGINSGPDLTSTGAAGWNSLVDPYDTVKALEAAGPNFSGTNVYVGTAGFNPTTNFAPYGDIRLVALTPYSLSSSGTYFFPHKLYNSTLQYWNHMAESLRSGPYMAGGQAANTYPIITSPYSYVGCTDGQLAGLVASTTGASTWNHQNFSPNNPAVTYGIVDATGGGVFGGDFDNGIGDQPDGPYANKPDEGDLYGNSTSIEPYFQSGNVSVSPAYFTPNRQVASPVMFGSLPTGVYAQKPWTTLLFHPDPLNGSSAGGSHPGSVRPKDYFLLDLFDMPVVEPYSISEPFSTAGRINMNYQIMPFGTSIVRETAMRSALQSTWLMAIPIGDASALYGWGPKYKYPNSYTTQNYRYPIDPDTTLTQFSARFNDTAGDQYGYYNRNFVSPAEICDIDLYPSGLTATATTSLLTIPSSTSGVPPVAEYGQAATGNNTTWYTFWTNNALTGANSRDVPYNHLYPLLTTKSNTFTVHMRVQTLKQVPAGRSSATSWATWTEGHDQVTGEYRGSTTIERYIDPTDPRLSGSAATPFNPDNQSLEPLYKFRVVSVKKFAP